VGPDSSVAECLREGVARLGAGDSALVVAGAADAACGLAEVEVPALKATELRGALGFELSRNCPLPPDLVVWGYRVLPAAKGTRLPVRLFFLRQTAWEQWLEAVGGLKLDAIMPPQAALDPILSGSKLTLPVAGGGRFLFVPNDKNGRAPTPATDGDDDAFGGGAEPLAWDCLQPGPLAQLPAEQQAGFTAALLLGAYGVSATFQDDRSGGLPVPYNLQPRRNRLNRSLAVVLVFLAVILGVVGLWREYAARQACLAALRAENARVQDDIARQTGEIPEKGSEDSLEALGKELREASLDLRRPSLAAVLVDLTEIVGPESWCYKVDWRDGRVTVELLESKEDLDLVRNLEQSPVLGDVMEQTRGTSLGKTIRKLSMGARWDLPNEFGDEPAPRKPPAGASSPTKPSTKPRPGARKKPGMGEQAPKVIRSGPAPGVPPTMRKKETR
jgi:Tfp pilus assembly protein PilN